MNRLVTLCWCGFTLIAATTSASDRYQTSFLDQQLENLITDTHKLVRIPTYRTSEGIAAEPGLRKAQTYLLKEAERFNAKQTTMRLQPFNWEARVNERDRWVFGFRLGTGPRKIAFITHLDTVPPEDKSWKPFTPRKEKRELSGAKTEFIVGRGALDDKGPSALAFAVMKALAKRFDGSDDLKGITFELVFDTAEETGGSIWSYFEATGAPDVGLVLDSVWCTVAEKGIERPTFTVPLQEKEKGSLWLASLDTPPGPTNQIPETARAVIKGRSKEILDAFAELVGLIYQSYTFDDPAYRAA
ncbi:MAG: M20/M25/M40 family metallo-hydrolase, partial [Deltaproteobacteria bacterium]|nr:M20/M25/M40 family metallo-hydrolase [Deltaproteobacteria bacterium]